MSNFTFLRTEWPDLHEAATKAEALAHSDARTACFYARRALELAVHWLYQHDAALTLPYQAHLSALIHEPTFKNPVGGAVFNKAVTVNRRVTAVEALKTAQPASPAGLDPLISSSSNQSMRNP